MEKKIFIIKHCNAEGQSSESQLTEKGFQQAIAQADFFQKT